MKLFNKDPNFSIVMPGGCNANCAFCFAKEKKCETAGMGEYIIRLVNVLSLLPKEFYQISITGGEPMLSPYLIPVLSAIYPFKERFSNILLTTNGTNLIQNIDVVSMVVDHINISRHHWDENANAQIFGGSYSVTDTDISQIIDLYSERGIDISANCVINDSTERQFIEDYISWSRSIGFRAVRFRKENGSLEKTPVELTYAKNKVVWEGSCPVCRTTKQIIHGYDVFWKSSVLEPSKVVNEVFEIVYAPDGKPYVDWEYKIPIHVEEKKQAVYNSYSSCGGRGSCGGSSSRC